MEDQESKDGEGRNETKRSDSTKRRKASSSNSSNVTEEEFDVSIEPVGITGKTRKKTNQASHTTTDYI